MLHFIDSGWKGEIPITLAAGETGPQRTGRSGTCLRVKLIDRASVNQPTNNQAPPNAINYVPFGTGTPSAGPAEVPAAAYGRWL